MKRDAGIRIRTVLGEYGPPPGKRAEPAPNLSCHHRMMQMHEAGMSEQELHEHLLDIGVRMRRPSDVVHGKDHALPASTCRPERLGERTGIGHRRRTRLRYDLVEPVHVHRERGRRLPAGGGKILDRRGTLGLCTRVEERLIRVGRGAIGIEHDLGGRSGRGPGPDGGRIGLRQHKPRPRPLVLVGDRRL